MDYLLAAVIAIVTIAMFVAVWKIAHSENTPEKDKARQEEIDNFFW